MRLAHQAHPDDLDLRRIFAEAILNRTPWRMWDPRTGEPAPGAGTLEAREVLEVRLPRPARRDETILACCTCTST